MSIPLADQTDTSSFRADHWGDPNGPPDTAVTNGFLDAPGSDPMARSRQTRLHAAAVGSVPAGDQHLLNPGSAGRANKGSTSSIPYIDCSDVDSEQDAARGHRVAAAAGPGAEATHMTAMGRRWGLHIGRAITVLWARGTAVGFRVWVWAGGCSVW